MDSLRLILLIAGIALVVAIYFYEKIRRSKSEQRYSRFGGSGDDEFVPRGHTRHPVPATHDFGDIPDDLEEDYEDDEPTTEDAIRHITGELERLESIISSRDEDIEQLELGDLHIEDDRPGDTGKRNQPDEIIIINVFARDERVMAGPDILESALQQDLQFGEMNFFHRMDAGGDILFSMANALQPGSFDIADMESLSTRGLVFFMNIPGNGDPLANFDAMLSTARDMANSLQGQLYDETRSILTRQGIDAVRTRISEYKLKSARNAESA